MALLSCLALLFGCASGDEIVFPSDTGEMTLSVFRNDTNYIHDTEAVYVNGKWYGSWTNNHAVYESDDLRTWKAVSRRPTGWYSFEENNWLSYAPCYLKLRVPYTASNGVEYHYALFDSLSEWGHQEARIRCFVMNDPAPGGSMGMILKSYYYVGDVMSSGQYSLPEVTNFIPSYEYETGEGPARYYPVEGYHSSYSVTDANGWNAIDPQALYDKDGRLYLVFGAWHGGIFITELDQSTLMPVSNKAEDYTRIAMHIFDQCIEGANILYHDGYYYLTVAYGDVQKTYNIRLARSESILGPYVDYNGYSMLEADGSIGTRLAGPYAFDGDDGFLGQGHAFWAHNPDTDEYFLLSNARVKDTLATRQMVRSVYFLTDGWPVLSPEMATCDTLKSIVDENGNAVKAPAAAPSVQSIPEETIPGSWEIIIHERLKAQLPKQYTSKRIVLNSDGTISGELTGTWNKTGDNVVNLIISGRKAEMFVTVGYDWENGTGRILVMSGLTEPGAANDPMAGSAVWMKQRVDDPKP